MVDNNSARDIDKSEARIGSAIGSIAPVEIVDNTDDVEPSLATINQKVQIQQRLLIQQQELQRQKSDAIAKAKAQAQAQAMIATTASLKPGVQEGVAVTVRAESNMSMQRSAMAAASPDRRSRDQMDNVQLDDKMVINKFSKPVTRDSKILTKSTLWPDQQHAEGTVPQAAVKPSGIPKDSKRNGYISDFYKNKNASSDGSHRLHQTQPNEMQYQGSQQVVPTNGNPAKKMNKISSKKFFQSKIDFSAPIKSLQQKPHVDPNLSDDSYIEHQYQAFKQSHQEPFIQNQAEQQMRGTYFESAKASELQPTKGPSEQFDAKEQKMTKIGGYANLSLIKEEDVMKAQGYVQGHSQVKAMHRKNKKSSNSIARSRKSTVHSVGVKKNLTDVSNQKKTYASIEPSRYTSPIKLPSLKSSKKGSTTSNTSNLKGARNGAYAGVQLQTVHERSQGFKHIGKEHIKQLSKKGMVDIHHVHSSKHTTKPLSLGSNIKGAPYYQQLSIVKPTAEIKTRASSNFRNKPSSSHNGSQLVKLPKFLKKDYNPVFSNKKLPVENDPTLAQSPSFDGGPAETYQSQAYFGPNSSRTSPKIGISQLNEQLSASSPTPMMSQFNTVQPNSSHVQKSPRSSLKNSNGFVSKAQRRIMNSSCGSEIYSIDPITQKAIQQHKQIPLAYRSINKFGNTMRSTQSRLVESSAHPLDPDLYVTEKQLPTNIEEEIKDGFFELKQKFKDVGPSSIYISHVVLHEKHPLLRKIEVETLKQFLLESSVIYLSVGQTLYKYGAQDAFVYIILFGKLILQTPQRSSGRNTAEEHKSVSETPTDISNSTQHIIGKVNIGWTLGEEILFDRNLQIRQEMAVAETESCLLGINKSKLAIMQKGLLETGNNKDYFVIESILKGNFLLKDQWRKDYTQEHGVNRSQANTSASLNNRISGTQVDASFNKSQQIIDAQVAEAEMAQMQV